MKAPALSRWWKSQVATAVVAYRRRLRSSLIPGSYSKIKLLNGNETIVSLEDAHFETISVWNAVQGFGLNTYAASSQLGVLHRLIVGLNDSSYYVADHINGDGLDNRRENLRVATRRENVTNTAWSDAIRLELKLLGFEPTAFKRAYRGRLWHYTPDGPVVGPRGS